MEELKRELQAIEPDQFMAALARVYHKQKDMSEATLMIDGLSTEYPSLRLAGTMAMVHAQESGLDEDAALGGATAALATVLALKEMIDVSALEQIPTQEF